MKGQEDYIPYYRNMVEKKTRSLLYISCITHFIVLIFLQQGSHLLSRTLVCTLQFLRLMDDEKERKKKNQLTFSSSIQQNSGSNLNSSIVKGFVCRYFALLCCGYHGVSPITYGQDNILNPLHLYISSTAHTC